MDYKDNLMPFKKGFDERRQNGRKKGSKNISTLVRALLETNSEKLKSDSVKKLIQAHGSRTAKEAIILAVMQKALSGDIKATEWLFNYLDQQENSEGSFFNGDIKIEIIDPKRKNEDLL